MNPDQWERVIHVFGEALRSSPSDPASHARDACVDEREVLAQVLLLLESEHEMPTSFCEPPERGERLTTPCYPPLARTDLVGKRIAGRYDVIELIAVGGMGEVYKATQVELSRVVALKTLRPGFDLARFKKESKILASLKHNGIAHVIDAGEHTDEQGTIPFFTMEHVADAESITFYAGASNLSIPDRLELFAGICDAVQAAHQKNIIHRDLKPENILVDADGHAKVIDFGVAWAADAVDAEHGGQPGTPPYMSPEQWDGKSEGLDVRSDVYSLGVVLYELLCARLPYDVRVCNPRTVEFDPPGAVNRKLAGDVDNIVRMALQKQRLRRYRNAGEFGDDIMRYLDGDRPEATRLAKRSRRRTKTRRVGLRIGLSALAAISVVPVLVSPLVPKTPSAPATVITPPPPPDVFVEVTADPWRGDQKIDFDTPLEYDDKVWVTLRADRAGTIYLFRLLPETVERYDCGPEDCDPIPYDPIIERDKTAECRYPQGQELRGQYRLVAILLTGESPGVCEETILALRNLGGAEENEVEEAVRDSVGNRQDIIGFDVFSYETR